jgi:muramidase (phage lysozyme)
MDNPPELDPDRGYAARNFVNTPNVLARSDSSAVSLQQAVKTPIDTGPAPGTPAQMALRQDVKSHLSNTNVKAFLQAIGEAEGGGYDFKYGAVKGKKNDKWRFTDASTHPGAGSGGKTTASGMYQITIDTWRDFGIKRMGLTDFSPETQDLIAVAMLRSVGVLDSIEAGKLDPALSKASWKWAALPQGKGLGNRYPKQPYMPYDDFIKSYKGFKGTVK